MECLVCLSPSAGVHYQANVCRACAAFFRRTVQKMLRYKCGKRSNCDVTHQSRFSCRFCRMKKCVAVGMLMSDEPSTSFDFYFDTNDYMYDCDREEQSIDRDEFYNLENIFEDHDKFFTDFQDRIENALQKEYEEPHLPFSLTMCQQISIAYAHHCDKWPDCKKENVISNGVIYMNQLVCDFYKGMENTAELCMEIKEFATLPFDQRKLVYKHFAARFPQIFMVFVSVDFLGNDVDDFRLVSLHGVVFDWNEEQNVGKISRIPQKELRNALLSTEKQVDTVFIKPFKRLFADDFEKTYLIASTIWDLEGVEGLSSETLKLAKSVRERLSDELNFYYKHEKNLENYAQRLYKIQNLLTSLDRVAEMREQDSMMSKTFQLFKIDVHLCDLLVVK